MSLSRRIASTTVLLAFSSAAVKILSFVTMPILTHLLSPTAYGIAAVAGTLIALVSVFALAGMDMSYIRALNANSQPSGPPVEVFVWRFALAAGLLSGAALIFSWRPISAIFDLPSYLGTLLGVGVFFSLIRTMTQTRARLQNRFRALSISMVISGLCAAAISVSVAYWWRQDELPLLLSIVAGYLIPVLILGIPRISQFKEPSGLTRKDRVKVLSIGLAGIITAPAYWVLSSSDRWILGYFENAASVGIYSIGYTVAMVSMMANGAVISVWTPETVNEFENNPEHAQTQLGRVAERLVAGYACIWLAVTAAGGDVIRLLSAPDFHDAASLVPYIAGGLFFHGIIHLANAILLLMKRLNYSIKWWITGGVICVMLNFILVPSFGRLGAAMTQTISFGVIAFGIVIGAQKFYPLQVIWSRLMVILTGTVMMGIVMSPAWANSPVLSLLLKLPVGTLAVVIAARIVAPEALTGVIRKIVLVISRI